MIRYNTDVNLYEFYNGTSWEEIEVGGDVTSLIARLAAHTPGDGASMIGLEDQGAVSGKTVQDLSEATIVAKNDNGTLVNGVFLDDLATGLLVNETGTGNLVSRSIIGTADQIQITNGSGLLGNIQVNIAPNPQLTGTSMLRIPVGTTAQRPGVPFAGDIRYNTNFHALEFWDNNASVWVQASGGSGVGGLIDIQYFTASGTWTLPSGASRALVIVIGGGGGGGGATGSGTGLSAGGGGGAGEYAQAYIAAGLGATETVTIGVGGAGGAVGSPPNNGVQGGSTSFGAHVSAIGGFGGPRGFTGAAAPNMNAGGAGGSGGAGGDIRIPGNPGLIAIRLNATIGTSGNGGPGALGGGSTVGSVNSTSNGNSGFFGSGGSGALALTAVQRAGGNGGNGLAIIWSFA
jgi:hypothetical protein